MTNLSESFQGELNSESQRLLGYLRYFLRRLFFALLVVLGAYSLSFLVLFALPGDPVAVIADGGGNGLTLSPEQLQALRAEYHLDRPVIEQYLLHLSSLFHGDVGYSIQYNLPVSTLIAQELPATLPLAGLGGLISVALGCLIAIARHAVDGKTLRAILEALPAIAASVPVFWVGLLRLQIFAFRLKLFPPIGNMGFRSLVLPAIALALPGAASIAQVFSSSLSTALAQPYCKYARAKGASRWQVLVRYAARNALPPVVGIFGVIAGRLFTGSVVVETVFTRQGLGRLTQEAVAFRDIPVVQGIVLFCAVVFVVMTLISDLIIPGLDPRVALASRQARP